jgi:hypothetical protein
MIENYERLRKWAQDAASGKTDKIPYIDITDLISEVMKLRAAAPVAQGWQPIETAPKDGTEVLLWLQPPYNSIEKARWFDLWGNWQIGEFPEDSDEYCGIGSALPTHWMPIPTPPVIAHSADKESGNG